MSQRFKSPDGGVAALGTLASFGALLSAAACCVLPLALGSIGLGASGLAAFVPYHWPLTIAAVLAVAAGWFLYIRKRRARAADTGCTVAPPTQATLLMLTLATIAVALSALWPGYIERPLMGLLGGA
ncbi:hypothetical protein [Sphingosinicella sp.]|uniref:hypothetical protein n=1 Tax=Sphingosinicella sp. TaxID=1917971 RepID=UPI0040376D3C